MTSNFLSRTQFDRCDHAKIIGERFGNDRGGNTPKSVYQNRSLEQMPADQGAAEVEEGLVDVVPALVAHPQPPVPAQPRQRPLDHPPVPPQVLLGLDPL